MDSSSLAIQIAKLSLLVATAEQNAADPRIVEDLNAVIAAANDMVATASEYQVLKGTPYSRYALPIEYMPSRDYRPRWGASRPPEPVVEGWFKGHTSQYVKFIETMRENAPRLADVPVIYDNALLPSPAWIGVAYCPFDAVALYTMIVQHKPKTYFEIGSGITTCFAARAIKDAGLDTKIVSLDPEPRAEIDALCDTVIRSGLEVCELDVFEQLEPGDILFFDGSHRSFMNSDVTVFMIDVLPRVKPGVIIHIHDITIPYDYPEMFADWYWSEQYILHVYLMGNRARIDPLLPTGFICRDAAFNASLSEPFIDLGQYNNGWRGGGAMWFTHKP